MISKITQRFRGLHWLQAAKWNTLGLVLPIVVAVPCLAALARLLSTTQFGFFSISIALIGYSGCLDMGLSRTVTYLIAKEGDEAPQLQWLLLLGLLGGTLLAVLAGLCATPFFEKPEQSLVLACSLGVLPLCLAIGLFSAVLEGQVLYQDLLLIRSVVGVSNYLLPVVGAYCLGGLEGALVGLVASKVAGLAILLRHKGIQKILRRPASPFNYREFKTLFSFGGWVAVHSFLGPILTYMDRMLLGTFAGATQLGLYTAPNEIAGKTNFVQASIARVVFPLYTNETDPRRKRNLFRQTVLVNALLSSLAVLFVFFTRDLIVRYWLGEQYSQCGWILVILTAGAGVSAVAFVPATCLQSEGRSRELSLFQIGEVIVFSALLILAIQHYSVLGAAIVMFLRCLVDACLLFTLHARRPVSSPEPGPRSP